MGTTGSHRSTVGESFLFREVPEEALDWALEHAEMQCAPRGAALFTPERFRHCLGVVLSGKLQVTRGELFVDVLSRGDWFGAAALFNSREDYPSTLTALTECTVLFFTQAHMEELMERWPRTGANYVRYLSGRICFLSDRLNSLSAGSAEDKVEHLLRQNADGEGAVSLSATAAAHTLGIGRASVYRAFNRLEERGVIARDGKQIRLNETFMK